MSAAYWEEVEAACAAMADERAAQLADAHADEAERTPRYCSYCTGGHNCPECSGWDDEEAA